MNAPQFSFYANSPHPEDKSGVATWIYQRDTRDGLKDETFSMCFLSFAQAFAMNDMIKAVYQLGEADGYANCQKRVLSVL